MMGIDLAALKAKLAAQKAAASTTVQGVNNVSVPTTTAVVPTVSSNPQPADSSNNNNGTAANIQTVSAPAVLGTSKTTEIEHLDFLGKMNSLAEAIHKQHPTMPVLLMQIHKQLRTDPELVTTLDEDAIGIIVRGLQIQTKTELVAEAVKKSSSGRAKKNPALSTDMF